jgi:fatty-acyl-CoA synthase
MTAGELLDLIARLAEVLRVEGAAIGNTVAIVAPITIEALAVRYAAGMLGCATVYCPNPSEPERLSEFIAAIAPDFVIVFPETAGPSATLAPWHVLSVGPVPNVADILATAHSVEVQGYGQATVEDTDLCALIATGGTTGPSKASRRDWRSYARMTDLGATPGRRQLICTPLAYVAQIMADATLIGGGQVVLRRTFEPSRILQTIEDQRITHLTLVEPLLVELVDFDRLSCTDLSSLIALSHVGADAAPSLRTRLLERLGRPILVSVYGVSECGVISALAAPDYSLQHPKRLQTAGTISPGYEVRIVDTDGNDCGDGELGSILVRGPALAQGYNVTNISSGFLDDGWFDTKDVGYRDTHDLLMIRGRDADQRTVNGHLVFPGDVQQAFCALPEVRYAVAVPAPIPYEGFGVAIVVENTATVTAADLVARVRSHAGEHMVPSSATLVTAVPTTEQGKPDRRRLIRTIWDGVETG